MPLPTTFRVDTSGSAEVRTSDGFEINFDITAGGDIPPSASVIRAGQVTITRNKEFLTIIAGDQAIRIQIHSRG